jgi:hypothetical protein
LDQEWLAGGYRDASQGEAERNCELSASVEVYAGQVVPV